MFVVGDGGRTKGEKVGRHRQEKRARGKIEGTRRGEMELCSLNMDVIFRAEQKERRRDERVKADMGCGKNGGSGYSG